MSNAIKFPNMFNVASGKVETITLADEAKQCIKCALHTVTGELFGDPSFGSNIKSLLFEHQDIETQDEIKKSIIDAANKYAKGIEIYKLHFDDPEINSTRVGVTIYYYLKSLAKSDSTKITFV